MTLPRYYQLREYWSQHPPTHVLMRQAFFKTDKTPSSSTPGRTSINDIGELMSLFGGGAGGELKL